MVDDALGCKDRPASWRGVERMTLELDHTIVPAHDKEASIG